MAEEGSPGVTQPTPQSPNGEPGATGTPPNQPEFVTREQLNEVMRRLDGMSASLRKVSETPPAVSPTAPAKPEGDGGKPRESLADKELRQRLEIIEKREAQVRAAAEVTHLRQAVLDAGVPKERVNTAVKVLRADLAGKTDLSDDATALMVKAANELHDPVAIRDYVSNWLRQDEGSFFLPPKQAPNVALGYNTPDGSHPWKSKSAEDIQKLGASNPQMFADYVRNHSEEWQSKLSALPA